MGDTVRRAGSPDASPPLVIFGTGGSGTRAAARIARHAGYFLGSALNDPEDSLILADFLERSVDRYLARVRWIQGVLGETGLNSGTVGIESGGEWDGMVADFRDAIGRHRAGIPEPGSRWGWKNPRSIFVLPFLRDQYPNMVALHVVRDGRDVAYSANQNQLRKHGRWVLSEEERRAPEPVQSMILWARVNLAAALYGERNLGANYTRVRLEDLCSDPQAGVGRIFGYLGSRGAPEASHAAALAEVQPPASLGRWRMKSAPEVASLTRSGAEALRRFGYL